MALSNTALFYTWRKIIFLVLILFLYLCFCYFIDVIFLHFQGDFLVHFMDIAREELNKKLDEINVEKLQVSSSIILVH